MRNEEPILRAPRQFIARACPAFTLVELLTVTAVIGILASLLLPALTKAKAKGQAILCTHQVRQLTLACQLYVDDHGDYFPYNFGSADTKKTISTGHFLNWANNVMSWELDPDNTNTAWVAAGGLGPYTVGATAIYRCPVDSVVSPTQRAAGWRARVRSLSMNAMVGNAGEFTTSRTNINNPLYRQFFRSTDIRKSSEIFVFVEEHPDSINDGYFLNKLGKREWFDLPASYHNGAANLSFADGHVELHRWVSPSTKRPARPDAAALPFGIREDQEGDYYWLMQRTTIYSESAGDADAR